MTHKKICEIETRTDDNIMKLYLFNENGWWRAYEWSAYLCNHLPCELDEANRLNPTKKNSSFFDGGIIFVGLKATSFEKYLPCLCKDVESIDLEQKQIEFDVSDLFYDCDFSNYKELLYEWKGKFKFKKRNEKKENETKQNETDKGITVKELLSKIDGFRVERKTPIEAIAFVSEIKGDVFKILNK